MIDNLLNIVFRCSHKRLTRPVTPLTKPGEPPISTYVACLDCGKRFSYDPKEMRIGKPVPNEHPPPGAPQKKQRRIRFALLLSIPLAALIASVFNLKGWLIRQLELHRH